MSEITIKEQLNSVADFKNPFEPDKVDRISINIYNWRGTLTREGKLMEAHVYFKNGNTSGDQAFYDDDISILLQRIRDFVNGL